MLISAAVLATSVAGAALAAPNCDVNDDNDKLKNFATDLLVNGKNTSLDGTGNGWLILSAIDTIDRELDVKVKLPEVTVNENGYYSADGPRCNRAWYCEKQDFTVCPGDLLTTAQFRGFTNQNADGQDKFRPEFKFTQTKDMFYSLLMVDLYSPGFIAATKGALGQCYFHYMAFNVQDDDELNELSGVDTVKEPIGPLKPAGNLQSTTPNMYTFMLFEHSQPLTFDVESSYFNGISCDFSGTLTYTGLNNAKLVSLSNFAGQASIVSRLEGLEDELLSGLVEPLGATCAEFVDDTTDPATPIDMCTYRTNTGGITAGAAAVGVYLANVVSAVVIGWCAL